MNSKFSLVSRWALGLLFIVFGINKFAKFMTPPPGPDAAMEFLGALNDAGYIFKTLGVLYVISGLLLIMNRAVGLALVILAPLVVNIFLFHACLDPKGLVGPSGLVSILLIVCMYLNRDKLRPLFS